MNTNQIIQNYIKNKNMNYAFLLTGEWGSGKTYYVNNIVIRDLDEYYKMVDTNKRIIYSSLYGIKSLDDISKNIFYQLINFNPESKFAKVSKFFYSNLPIKINFDEAGFENLYNLNDNLILIIDDLERVNLPIDLVLGYLNNYVEHNKIKLVLICNEAEIKNQNKYIKIKEKMVGITHKFKADINSVINSIIEQYRHIHNGYYEELTKYKEKIIDIFIKSNKNNFRILNNTLINFLSIYLYAVEKHEKLTNLMFGDALIYCLALSFEINTGNTKIKLDKAESFNGYILLYNMLKNKNDDENINFINKYSLGDLYNGHNFASIYNFIKYGEFDKEQFDKEIDIFYNIKELSSVDKIYKASWWELSDDEFNYATTDIINKLNDATVPLTVLPRLFWLFKTFSDEDLIKIKIDELVDIFSKSIIKIGNKTTSHYVIDFGLEMFESQMISCDYYNKIKKMAIDINQKIYDKEIELYYRNSIEEIKQNKIEIDVITYQNKYNTIPWLKYVNVEQLFSLIINLDNKSIIKFRNYIDNVYERNRDFLLVDKMKLKEFKEMIETKITGKDKANGLKLNVLKVMHNSIEKLLNL